MRPFALILVTILAISACCLAQAPATDQPVAPTFPKPVMPNNNGVVVNNGYATSAATSPPRIIAPTADPNAMTNPVAAANAAPNPNTAEQPVTTGPVRAINLGGASFSTIYTAPAAPDHRS